MCKDFSVNYKNKSVAQWGGAPSGPESDCGSSAGIHADLYPASQIQGNIVLHR